MTFDGELNEIVQRTIHPDDLERVMRMNDAVILERSPTETEYRVVWPDGSVRHVWAMPGDRVTDEQGNITQLSGVVQDITERRLAQDRVEAKSETALLSDPGSRAWHLGG